MNDKEQDALNTVNLIIDQAINQTVSRVLDGVNVSIGAARKALRDNPDVRLQYQDDPEFVHACDFGMWVAQVIVERTRERFNEKTEVIN